MVSIFRKLWCRLGQHAGYVSFGAFRCAYCPYVDYYDKEAEVLAKKLGYFHE